MNKLKLKIGDTVKIIAGRDKGLNGKITHFKKNKAMVILEKCNLKFKHLKPINQDNQGQRKQIEAPIDISNVMLCDSDTIASRFRTAYSDDNGKKVRISKKTNQLIL